MKPSTIVFGAIVLAAFGCRRSRTAASTHADAAPLRPEPTAAASTEVRASAPPPAGDHPRLLLTRERVDRARRNVAARSPVFARIEAECTQAARVPEHSGYEGWDWGNLVASCGLAWRLTGKSVFADAALRYFRALLDDREVPGDEKGGDAVVRHDHGYAIRTHAFYAALGYDWLHDAPGTSAELRAHAIARLSTWLDWYEKEGYRRADPISNYFTGYFGALAYAGLATAGDDPRGDALLRRADALFDGKIAPSYGKLLAGGDWPEGWQYGDGAATVMGLFVDGEKTALGRDRLSDLPWLRDVARMHAFEILPDGSTAYDNGDWSDRPAKMPSRALDVIAMILPDADPTAAGARFLARELRKPRDDWAWIQLLADGPRAEARDPRQGSTSWLAKGTGLLLARSAWSPDATFVSFQCGPSIPDADHQHADQGHFEVVRGADPLFVDVGDYGSLATINHNTILVDDHGKSLDYAPNQGAWGRDSHMARYVDAGDYVFAEGDFSDAYRPSKLEWGAKRSVLRAERSFAFLRPGTVVLYDRVTVADPSYDVRWIAHALVRPDEQDGALALRKGTSIAWMTTLLPDGAHARIVPESGGGGAGPYETNKTWTPTFRAEVAAPHDRDARFLTVIQTGGVGATALPASRIAGDAVDGAAIGRGNEGVAIVFPKAGQELATVARWESPRVGRQIVVGLSPGARYAVASEAIETGCRFSVRPGPGPAADRGGTLLVRVSDCVVR